MKIKEAITNVTQPFYDVGYANSLYAPINTDVFQTMLENCIKLHYGNREIIASLIESVTAENTIDELIRERCTILYTENAYKYLGMYNTTKFVYNPIDNTNVSETVTNNMGQKVTTLSQGAKSNTENLGVIATTQTDSKTPFDSDSFKNTDKSVAERSSTSNTYNEGEKTDSSTESAVINSEERTRAGNIGVTTTQQMIQAEREILDFSFVLMVAHDIINVISCGVVTIEDSI